MTEGPLLVRVEEYVMEHVYEPPVVEDAGAVVSVTLGNKNFDTADDSNYVKDEND